MEKRFFSAIITFCLLILGTAPAFAKMPGIPETANIPFDFMIRGKTLPAGRYEVTVLNNNDLYTLCVRSMDHGGIAAIVNSEPVIKHGGFRQSAFIFHRYGDTYFLDEITEKGEDVARELIPSRQERNLERQVARNDRVPKAEVVTVAAN